MRWNSPGKRDAVTLAISTGMALWFGVTTLCQHPNRNFDLLRKLDPFGTWIPNWRFFAPEPSQHDFSLLYRVLTADDKQTPWAETAPAEIRKWSHAFWFPSRRHDKALFDLCARVVPALSEDVDDARQMFEYRLLKQFVEHRVRTECADDKLPKGFQFLLAQHAGYDEHVTPEYLFVSEFVPLEPRPSSLRAA